MTTIAHQLIENLRSRGIDTVFGLPGVHTLAFMPGLHSAGIRHVGVRNEQGAAFMADGYARSSGRPGVCLVISGPGVTNAATGIGQAYSDSVPMLVLSSCNARSTLGLGWGMLHEIPDQAAVTRPLTAFSALVHSPDQVAPLLAHAFALFEAARPRPVHLSIPLDVLDAPAATDGTVRVDRVTVGPASGDAVGRAATALAAARRPFVVVGGGAAGAAAALTELAERLHAPVATTVAGKGVVADDHPLCLGANLHRAEVQRLARDADLVLIVGSELAEPDVYVSADSEAEAVVDTSRAASHGALDLTGRVIRIDLDPRVLVGRYPVDVALLGDAAQTASALLTALAPHPPRPPAPDVASVRAELRRRTTPLERKHLAVLGCLRRALGRDGIVAADMTQIAFTGNALCETYAPRTWLFPNGFGTMGYAVPAAIGAKLARPDRAVAALTGDGSLQMTLQELGTAVEQRLPIPVVLWNNGALREIRDFMRARGLPEISVEPLNPDFLALARSFGCRAVRPGSLDELEQSIRDALTGSVPTLLEVMEDSEFLR